MFIGSLSPAADKEAAEKFIGDCRKEFYDATHNCFAYRIHPDDFRFSDDGEPSGTAGKPILSMIDKYELQLAVLVVTRYFGGTKLGTGGLIRAYSACAEAAIAHSKIIKSAILEEFKIAYPFDMINKVQHAAQNHHARIQQDASPEGMISTIDAPPSRIEKLREELISATAGKVRFL